MLTLNSTPRGRLYLLLLLLHKVREQLAKVMSYVTTGCLHLSVVCYEE